MALSDWNFGVFIISHGRPNTVITDKTLRRSGYTGRIWYVIDNEDKTGQQYRDKYGDAVIEFDKKWYADRTDEGDNFDNRRTTTHARNACFDIAEKLGIEWFLVLDDDYSSFDYRTDAHQQYPTKNWKIGHLDDIFDVMLSFIEATPFTSIAMAQGGDMIGGIKAVHWMPGKPTLYRKAMNSWFCSTFRHFRFISRLNEDVNTYTTEGMRGLLFGTVPLISLTQQPTQGQSGGMTDAYIASGTYVKSFATVMYCPSFVKVSMLNTEYTRIHHRIDWKSAVPCILDERYSSQRSRHQRT